LLEARGVFIEFPQNSEESEPVTVGGVARQLWTWRAIVWHTAEGKAVSYPFAKNRNSENQNSISGSDWPV